MNPKSTALVLIEFQNDFVKAGGAEHEAVKDVMASARMFTHTQELIAAARNQGVTVDACPDRASAEGYSGIAADPYGILTGIVASSSFQKGAGAPNCRRASATKGDILVEGKRGFRLFRQHILISSFAPRISHVAVAGFLTNCCMDSTMRSA